MLRPDKQGDIFYYNFFSELESSERNNCHSEVLCILISGRTFIELKSKASKVFMKFFVGKVVNNLRMTKQKPHSSGKLKCGYSK
ncbi:MAG: hypothetical protein P9M11_09050 [Candidatus Tenebribacter burtonii]|jgi:hypothetical protein|nr:hypothetical protein [Candidatus Tenebribacter burtonii]